MAFKQIALKKFETVLMALTDNRSRVKEHVDKGPGSSERPDAQTETDGWCCNDGACAPAVLNRSP